MSVLTVTFFQIHKNFASQTFALEKKVAFQNFFAVYDVYFLK